MVYFLRTKYSGPWSKIVAGTLVCHLLYFSVPQFCHTQIEDTTLKYLLQRIIVRTEQANPGKSFKTALGTR